MTVPEASPDSGSPRNEKPAAPGSAWAWPVMWMVVVTVAAISGLYIFKSCRDLPGETLQQTGQLAQQLGQQVQKIASAFRQGTVTTTFTSYATALSGSQYLQFATLSQQETFTRTDESSLLFGYIPLPDVIVQASAPVTYTYYLDLNARWDFVLRDGVIWVTAPDIKYNKPALDVSHITYEIKKDSHFRDTSDALENLRSSMTSLCYLKARTNIDLVRETGRRQTEAFVQNWLAKSFADGRNYPVKVRFRSEKTRWETGPIGTPKTEENQGP